MMARALRARVVTAQRTCRAAGTSTSTEGGPSARIQRTKAHAGHSRAILWLRLCANEHIGAKDEAHTCTAISKNEQCRTHITHHRP